MPLGGVTSAAGRRRGAARSRREATRDASSDRTHGPRLWASRRRSAMTTATAKKHAITRADILDPAAYARDRRDYKKRVTELKRDRRIEVGPFVTFYFENYDTMWHQIHEMLYIEKGGEQQISDELEAYTPLIPQGQELIATVMIEIEDPMRRARVLAT